MHCLLVISAVSYQKCIERHCQCRELQAHVSVWQGADLFWSPNAGEDAGSMMRVHSRPASFNRCKVLLYGKIVPLWLH